MIGPGTTAIVVGIALLIFGPKRLPEIGRALGQGLGNFKKAFQDAQEEVKSGVNLENKPPETNSETAKEEPKAG
jgi:sec-independent protein translocase protein TatA